MQSDCTIYGGVQVSPFRMSWKANVVAVRIDFNLLNTSVIVTVLCFKKCHEQLASDATRNEVNLQILLAPCAWF